MRCVLKDNGIKNDENSFGDEYFTDDIFKILQNNVVNKKGETFIDRFRDVISDPNNLFIKRSEFSGQLENNVITLHNDIKVYDKCYYNNFSDILILNRGVHEPSEERAFSKVIKHIRENGNMVELGSYWAFYSMWFLKNVPNGKTFCIDSDENCLQSGIKNFKLNSLEGDFTKSFIGYNGIDLTNFIREKAIEFIDILHSDIQGYEFEMLNQIKSLLLNRKIKYLFLSTHNNELHNNCINLLKESGYKILCSCDYDNETFQYDGFILSCPDELNEIDPFLIGNRKNTKLISTEEFNQLLNYAKR
jgi:hypothetical protein